MGFVLFTCIIFWVMTAVYMYRSSFEFLLAWGLSAILFAISLFTIPSNASTKIPMGDFKLTAYCPCEECSEGYGWRTSTGKPCRSYHTIAVDPDIIDYGSKVLIGDTVYTAEDCGGGVNGDHIDIFFDTHEEVEEFGVKYKEVWVVR